MRIFGTRHRRSRGLLGLIVLGLVATAAARASADEVLRVGKANAVAFSFVPVDVGIATGVFAKHGLKVEASAFAGSAKVQQALGANAIDLSLSSGPELAFLAKGNPALCVASIAGPPRLLVIIAGKEAPIHSIADLKGKTISVSTVGSLTMWLTQELSRREGWGTDGIKTAALGEDTAQIAAMKTNQIDGMVIDIASAYRLEESGDARIVARFGDMIKDFEINVIYATRAIVDQQPQKLRDFLAGWFETIAYMRKNKAETVRLVAPVMNVSATIADKVYDELMPAFSDDGKIDPKALDVLAKSFVEMGTLPQAPDLSKFVTENFLPH
jgi:ABC-type nitrate/sulfonate/bicarbonate transport system substrate-binding protein